MGREIWRWHSLLSYYSGSKDNLGYTIPIFPHCARKSCSPTPKPISQHDLKFILGEEEQDSYHRELSHGKSDCVRYFNMHHVFNSSPKTVPLFYMRQRKTLDTLGCLDLVQFVQQEFRGQLEGQVSPSTVWTPGMDLRWFILAACAFTYNRVLG